MQLDQKALIEEAVQASIDAGLAVDGEHGVAAARHAARFMFNALQAVQPVPVVTDEPEFQTAPDNGTVDEVLAYVLDCARRWEPKARIIGNARAGDIVRALTATASAEPVDAGFQGFVLHGSYCATEGCGNFATVHFIRGGVGSFYCQKCYPKVQALGRSPYSTGRQSG